MFKTKKKRMSNINEGMKDLKPEKDGGKRGVAKDEGEREGTQPENHISALNGEQCQPKQNNIALQAPRKLHQCVP